MTKDEFQTALALFRERHAQRPDPRDVEERIAVRFDDGGCQFRVVAVVGWVRLFLLVEVLPEIEPGRRSDGTWSGGRVGPQREVWTSCYVRDVHEVDAAIDRLRKRGGG